MLLADVVVGRSHQPTKPLHALRQAPSGCHSVHGRAGSCRLNYDEHVVYRDDACLPVRLYVYSYTSSHE